MGSLQARQGDERDAVSLDFARQNLPGRVDFCREAPDRNLQKRSNFNRLAPGTRLAIERVTACARLSARASDGDVAWVFSAQ
jgi:hypothetical protein